MRKNNLPPILFFTITVLAVFGFYFHTIFYAVKAFDEITPFKEIHLPVCFSFSEIFELISLLGLHNYFEASNTLYSSIISMRSNPLGDFFVFLVQFFCRKNPANYHLYSLILHLISSGCMFLILNKISLEFFSTTKTALRLFATSMLTFLWATHPANIESVLLLTNYNAVFSHTLCILTIYIYLNFTPDSKKFSILKSIVLFLIFFIAVFTAEYLFMLPLILFSYTFATSKSFKHSLKQTLPLFTVSILLILSFLFSNSTINLQAQSSTLLTIERVFWFAPQVFFHLTKLFIFPMKLSVDQTSFVKIGKAIFSPFAIFCICTTLLVFLFSLKSLLDSKKQYPFFFIIFIPFFLSLVPFLHIFAPIYNLASERYLYLPSFIFIFGFSHLIFHLLSKNKIVYPSIIFLLIITPAYSIRAFIRTLDWKDSFTLYKSAIDATDNSLYKAFRYKLLTSQEKIFSKFQHEEVEPIYQQLAINNLELTIKDLEAEKQKHQEKIPLIVKSYGLDPATLLAKAGYLLAHSNYTINNDPQKALNIINPFVKDLSLLDNAGLAFYASLHFFNKSLDETEKILRYAHKKYPYSTRITFPLCQLIYIKTGNLDEVEKFSLLSYKYFPYDTFTLLYLVKLYKLKGNNEKYAFFSYVYGLRHHSIESLGNARNLYLTLNKFEIAQKIEKRIICLKMKLNKKM
jgi:hypothetical protein